MAPTHKWSELDHKASPEQISEDREKLAMSMINDAVKEIAGVRVKNYQTGEYGILAIEPDTSRFVWMIYTASGHELGYYNIRQFQREGWDQA